MMSKWPALILIVAAMAVGFTSGRCLGQGAGGRRPGPTRFQPSRPTVSPYLNLFRRDTGPIPNYHLYVRPIQRQQAFNDQQQLLNLQQGMEMQQLQENLIQVQRSATGPTGIGAGFRNFSHYYSGIR
jgi:hypothetical protein